MKYEKRLYSQLHEMTDMEVYEYLWFNSALVREHSRYTTTEENMSKYIIREVIRNAEKEDFIHFVRLCYDAFKNKNDANRFLREIVSYIQSEYKILRQSLQEEPLQEDFSFKTYFFPSSLDYHDPFLYDFSYDFFYNNAGEAMLRTKYKLNHYSYKKLLAKLDKVGLVPTPL